MKLSTEAKVGSMSLIGLLLLAYMIINLGNFSFSDKGYPVQAVFSQVNGLKAGNAVRYAGVDVGKVKVVDVMPDGVRVTIMINNGVKIPEGSKFSIGTDGLLGEKYINITPPTSSSGFISPNAIVRGEDVQGLEQVLNSADKVLAEIHLLVKSLNDVLGDEKVKAAFKDSIFNMREITINLNEMSAALARMAINNEGDINAMVDNLLAMSGSLRSAASRVDSMLDNVDNNGQTISDIKAAVQNIKITSQRVEKMAASLEGVVTDPETAKNIKETLSNARAASAKANNMLSKVDAISAKAGVEVLYNNDSGKYTTNADVKINTSPENFAVIGVTGIGEGSKGNFQIGAGNDNFASRAGVIDGKAGLGVDTKVNNKMRVSLDVYDPNDVRYKLRTQYQMAPDTFIVGQAISGGKEDSDNTFIGIRRNF